MLTVIFSILLIICIAAIITMIVLFKKDYDCDDGPVCVSIATSAITGFAAIVILVFILVFMGDIATENLIDQRIELYQTQNAEIESDIDILVKEYMKFESDTFESLKSESSMTLVNLYPELKSNELVKSQIELYRQNNSEILKLKEEKIELGKKKWLVYFGH